MVLYVQFCPKFERRGLHIKFNKHKLKIFAISLEVGNARLIVTNQVLGPLLAVKTKKLI